MSKLFFLDFLTSRKIRV